LDHSFDGFHAATEFGFDHNELDGHDEPASAQPHKLAGRSDSPANQQQRLLPAQNAMIK
jgi:hypothetical protein